MSAINKERFRLAQEAEQDNWARKRNNAEHVRYELDEHAEVEKPLREILGDTTFERGLEVGVGPYGLGFLGVHMGDAVAHIDGVDPLARLDMHLDDEALQARVDEIRSRVRYVQGPGEALAMEDAAYDIVSCINVVDHGQDPAKILAEIDRVLRPGGLLLFGVSTLSCAGLAQWQLKRRLNPQGWLFVAHPHIFEWRMARGLVEMIPGETLWDNRPTGFTRWLGHGRMSFWIRRKR